MSVKTLWILSCFFFLASVLRSQKPIFNTSIIDQLEQEYQSDNIILSTFKWKVEETFLKYSFDNVAYDLEQRLHQLNVNIAARIVRSSSSSIHKTNSYKALETDFEEALLFLTQHHDFTKDFSTHEVEWLLTSLENCKRFHFQANRSKAQVQLEQEIQGVKESLDFLQEAFLLADEAIQERLWEAIASKQAIRDSLNRDLRALKKSQNTNPVKKIDDLKIQEVLDKDSHLAYYFSGPNYVFLILIDHQHCQIINCGKTTQLENYLSDYKLTLLNDPEGFAESNGQLYEYLWAPIAEKIKSETTVYVVPDGILSAIAFEALSPVDMSTWNRNFKELDLLFYSNTFVYAHSANDLYLQLSTIQDSDRQPPKVLLVAPVFDSILIRELDKDQIRLSKLLNPIAQTAMLVNRLNQRVPNCQSLLRENATRENLQQSILSGIEVLHLSTHTEIDNDFPTESVIYLSPDQDFSDQLILKDIFLLFQGHQLQFVVLESCDSGAGELPSGQGIAGFAYELSLAGVPSLVYSLWPLEESSNNFIVERLFHHLQKGLDKHRALRQAKLDYLESSPPQKSAPFYWAGMVFTGQTAPLYASELQFEPAFWLWFFGAGVLGLVLFIFRNRKKKSYPSP